MVPVAEGRAGKAPLSQRPTSRSIDRVIGLQPPGETSAIERGRRWPQPIDERVREARQALRELLGSLEHERCDVETIERHVSN